MPIHYEAFPTLIALLTATHLGEFETLTEIVEERSHPELQILIVHAIGMLYAATMSDARARGEEYLEFISSLSMRGHLRDSDS